MEKQPHTGRELQKESRAPKSWASWAPACSRERQEEAKLYRVLTQAQSLTAGRAVLGVGILRRRAFISLKGIIHRGLSFLGWPLGQVMGRPGWINSFIPF